MKTFGIAVVLAIVISLGYYLGAPLFMDNVVDEDFSYSSSSSSTSSTSSLTAEDKEMITKMESMSDGEVEDMPEEEKMEMKDAMDDIAKKMPDVVVEDEMQMEAEPTVVLMGTFQDADSFHKGSGKATIYELPDGRRVVRFENFEVTNGPALSVYLTQGTQGDVSAGYIDLGKLKGNKGNQNYEIPAEVDLSAYQSIVIRCVPFAVTFATASLQ